MNGRYYVGEWLVEPEQNRVVRGSESAKLDPKSIQVLSFLVQHPNEVLTKEQIIDSVWDGAFVSDEVLTTAIWGLRKALGDDAKEPRYIQTIPRRGYRLIAPVERATGETSGRWEPSPYPGLSAFSQRDAQFFFGREAEVEALWAKLQERGLVGLIGPSGAGKSSLLRAGLIPACPEGWGVLLCQPRNDPFRPFEGFDAWRGDHTEALVIVDQFEELFTLNDEETQGRFAEHLARLSQSGVHVLLSMRDDFLIRCHTQPSLAPVFKDLTPVLPLEGAALRRALTEPARASGYRFEDEALVAEILTDVSRERGALPLLAFAASKLWERRDREKRLLTREAYLSIGGVAGALAKHAEETLSKIGLEREPIVREIFRNLTSSQGTRVPTERDELLSVFSDRATATAVLGELIDARLLTSSERDVEIIHESLLAAWPRLVRWQTQDADAAVLRDQLRQAARHWEERRRPRELLWTGTPYREFELWRDRYPGGLTSLEDAYANAMVGEARRRRTRQLTAVAVIIGLLLAAVGVMSSLWRRAVLEAERREAAQVLALGRLELDDNPTAALAYSLASLERADSDEARRFALEALWHGAAAIVLDAGVINGVDFSPDGRWLATGGLSLEAHLWSIEGGSPKTLPGTPAGPLIQFSPGSDFLAAGGTPQSTAARFWSVADGGALGTVELDGPTGFLRRGTHFFSLSTKSDSVEVVRDWRAPDENPGILTSLHLSGLGGWDIDASGEWFASGLGNGVYVSPLRDPSRDRARLIGTHEAKVVSIASHPTASRIVSGDETGEIRIWSLSETSARLERRLRAPNASAFVDPTDSSMVIAPFGPHSTPDVAFVWDLKGPPDAEPRALRNSAVTFMNTAAIDPTGQWLATGNAGLGILWPLRSKYARVLRGQSPPQIAIAFAPDGRSLVSTSDKGPARLWPLSSEGGARSRTLTEDGLDGLGYYVDVDPRGRFILVASRFESSAFLVPLDGGETRRMPGFEQGSYYVGPVAFSPDGRLAVAAGVLPNLLRIWDLESGEVRRLETRVARQDCGWEERWKDSVMDLRFLADGRLLTVGEWGIRIWNLEDGGNQEIRPCLPWSPTKTLAIDGDRRRFLVLEDGTFSFYDLETGYSREITSHGNRVSTVALDPTGTVAVSGDLHGVLRVGPVTGEEPHLLFGHTLEISSVAVSPDGKWIASASQDGTIRLWPMPEGPPFHALPYDEILDRIRALTNLRVVEDEQSETGYRVEVGPFPGWKTLPRW